MRLIATACLVAASVAAAACAQPRAAGQAEEGTCSGEYTVAGGSIGIDLPLCSTSSTTTSSTTSAPPPPTSTSTTPTTSVAPTSTAPSTTTTTTAAPTTTAATTTTTTPAGVLFADEFDTAADLEQYVWGLFWGGTFTDPNQVGDAPKSWWGDHSNACSSPATSMPPTVDQLRLVHAHAAVNTPSATASMGEMVWWCAPGNDPTRGHFMSASDGVGYSSIAFTPQANGAVRTFNNVRRICWDMSLNDVAGWWLQVDVIERARFDSAHSGRLFYMSPSLGAEVARNAEHLGGSDFMFQMARGSTHTFTGSGVDDPNFTNVFAIPGFPHHDRAKRYRHCITDLENGTIRAELFGRRSATDVEVRNHAGAIPNGPVVVIFEHSAYHNSKDAAHYDTFEGIGDELTVHWDNVMVSS